MNVERLDGRSKFFRFFQYLRQFRDRKSAKMLNSCRGTAQEPLLMKLRAHNVTSLARLGFNSYMFLMPLEKNKTLERPVVWKYKNYRKYLNDCVNWKKAENSKFSYAYFAKALGTTKSYLKLVTSQKRNISIDKIIKTSKLFQHSILEQQYFIFLFLENQTEDQEMKVYFQCILRNFIPDGQPRYPIVEVESEKKYDAMRDWLMLSICGLAACKKYEHNEDWIHKQLGGNLIASKPQVRDALNRLVDRKVIVKNGESWKLNVESQMRSFHPLDFDQAQVYKTGLHRALLAVDLFGKTNVHEPKSFFINIVAVNENDQKKIIELFHEFKKSLWEVTHASQDPDRVMLISNSIISLNGEIQDQS